MSDLTKTAAGSPSRRIILRLAVIMLTLGTAVTHVLLAFPGNTHVEGEGSATCSTGTLERRMRIGPERAIRR